MTEPIPEPLHGADVISWAQPVTRALNALRDKVGAKARNERDRRPTQQPQPFEVRWDGSLNNSSGGWKIYLPTEHLLSYGDIDVATSDISGATAIQDDDNNDTPWFSLDDVDTSADHVWLVVTVTESSGGVTVEAEFATEEGQAATGEKVVNVCIAEVSYEEPEDEGDPAVVVIKQSVVGALHLGGDGTLTIKQGATTLGTFTANQETNTEITIPEAVGKTITNVDVTPSSSETVVKFIYSDGTFTEIHIPHGLKGDPGAPGLDGDTPEITASKQGGVTNIFADGVPIAQINDGSTPTITATKANGVTTIYADGVPIAQINDGASGTATLPDKNVVTGVSFAISGGKLVATLTKENLKTGATSTSTANVCDVGELDVVVSEDYSTSTHQFTNTRKRIKTIGSPVNANGQTPFTATPLSGE